MDTVTEACLPACLSMHIVLEFLPLLLSFHGGSWQGPDVFPHVTANNITITSALWLWLNLCKCTCVVKYIYKSYFASRCKKIPDQVKIEIYIKIIHPNGEKDPEDIFITILIIGSLKIEIEDKSVNGVITTYCITSFWLQSDHNCCFPDNHLII